MLHAFASSCCRSSELAVGDDGFVEKIKKSVGAWIYPVKCFSRSTLRDFTGVAKMAVNEYPASFRNFSLLTLNGPDYSFVGHGFGTRALPLQTQNPAARGHAITRMFQRSLSKNAVRQIIVEGEVIADYPDDSPYPSCLLLGYCDDEPVHIVVAQDKGFGKCFVVTAYKPDRDKWSDDFRSRRQ